MFKRDDGVELYEDDEKAKQLSRFFQSVFTREVAVPSDHHILDNVPTFDSVILTKAIVQQELLRLKEAISPGPDEIPAKLLKELATELAEPLCFLFQASLDADRLPSGWKTALISPIQKSGSRASANNYRPRENKGPQNTEEKQVRAKVDQVMKQFNGKENATSEEDAVDAEVAGKELPPLEDSDVHVEPLQNSEVRSEVVKGDIDEKDHSSTNVSTKVVNNTIPSGTKRKDTIGQHFVHKRGPANGTETAAQSQAPLQQQLFGAAFPQIQPIFVPSALPSFATPSLTSPLAPFSNSHPFITNQRFKFMPHVQDKSIDGSAQVPQNVPASVAGCYGVPQNNSGKEYYVMVHVDAGEVFSIRIGDHVQHIPGPATVRLVSNTGPPLPMPIHVPAGHLVQQIVDEEGILTHMILSPFPGPPSPYLKDGAPIMPSPGSSTDVSNGPHLPTNKQLPRIFPNASERPGAPLFCGGSIGGAYQPGPRRSGFGAQLPLLQPHHLQASVTHIGIPLTTQPYQQLQSNTTGSGFNVVISPKTSPGLAVAGPTAASPVVPWQPSLPQLSEVNVAMAPPLILGTAGAEQSKCPVISANGTAFTEKMETGTKVCKNDTVGTETAVNGSKIYDKETALVSPDDAVDEHDRNDCSPEEAPKSSPVIGCEPEPLRNGLPSPDSKKTRKKKDSKSLTARKTARSPDSSRSMDECASKATAAAGGDVEINEQSKVTSPSKSSSCDPKVSPTAPNRSSTSSRKNPTGAKRKTVPQNKINQNCTGALPAEADALVSKATTHLQTSPNLKMSKDQSAETSVCSTDASSKTTTTTPSTAGVNTPTGSGGGGDKKGTEAGLMMHFPGLLPGGVFPLCPSHPHHHHPLVPQFYGAPSLPFHPDQISSMTLRPGFFAGPPQFHPSPSAPPGTSSQPGPPPPAPPPPPPTFMAPFNPYFIPHPTMLPPHSVYHYPCEFLAGPPQFKPTSSFTEEECAAILKVLSKISQPKISSVDCRSVTINLSIPENLSIVPTEAATTQVAPASGTAVMPSTTDAAATPTAANMDALVPNANPSDSATQTDPVLQSRIWSISPSDLRFGLYLAENDGVFNCVYLGETPCILLQDLRPAVRYFIKACCIYEGLMGSFSETADFVTLSTKPSVLRPPVVMSKTKNSLSIRWTSAADNGSRITEYCLQFATLPKAGNLPVFYNCYKGPQRFHKLNHLNPSTSYLLRVCATNSHGQSPWSDAVSATTSGLPPPTPEPPHLLEATSQSLRLSWRPRTPPPPQSNQNSAQAGEEQNPEETKVRSPRRGVRHVLEMLDTETKQQQQQQQSKQQSQQRFKQVYEGDALECLVEGLRRSSLYRFRLAAGNSDGLSAWSDPVAFRTAPDNPSAPRSLRV
nr:unnamed protein product [Spirometra erinaceieuropaei]